jgi:hypothetical protein
MDTAGKIRENRLRRIADRQGLRLEKSPRRDPRATGYGTFRLVGAVTGKLELDSGRPGGYGLSLDQVEKWLTGGDDL